MNYKELEDSLPRVDDDEAIIARVFKGFESVGIETAEKAIAHGLLEVFKQTLMAAYSAGRSDGYKLQAQMEEEINQIVEKTNPVNSDPQTKKEVSNG